VALAPARLGRAGGAEASQLPEHRADELAHASTLCGRGGRVELAPDDEGLDAAEVPIYCPDRWTREFDH
jgi:hypothetical protein